MGGRDKQRRFRRALSSSERLKRLTAKRRFLAAFCAAAISLTALAGIAVLPPEAGAGEPPPAVQCKPKGHLFPLRLWRWACNSGANGDYWQWWMNPRVTSNPHLDAAQVASQSSQIAPDGAVRGATTSTESSQEASIDYMFAVGQRPQPFTGAAHYPHPWNPNFSKAQIDRAVDKGNPAGQATAYDFLRSTMSAACPTSVSLAARTGYALSAAANLDPATYIPNCNLEEIVHAAYNSATGQFGSGLNDTIWSLFAVWSWGDVGTAFDGAKIAEYIKSLELASGGWGSSGTFSTSDTALAMQALLATGVSVDDASISAAVDALAAAQNADAGWGPTTGAETTTIETAQVHGTMRALEALLPTNKLKYWNEFTATTSGHTRQAGVQYALGITLQDQRLVVNGNPNLGQSRFYFGIEDKTISEGPSATPSSDVRNTRPTSNAMFYTYAWHPLASIPGSVSPLGPDTPSNPNNNVPAAVVANPTVTG